MQYMQSGGSIINRTFAFQPLRDALMNSDRIGGREAVTGVRNHQELGLRNLLFDQERILMRCQDVLVAMHNQNRTPYLRQSVVRIEI